MRADLFAKAEIVCPRCRRPERGRMVQASVGLSDIYREEAGEVSEALLACADSRCGTTYPIVEGVPILLKDIGSWWRHSRPSLSSVRSSSPPIRDFFQVLDAEGAAGIDAKSMLGAYIDFHYGKFVEAPAPPAPYSGAVDDSYWEKIAGMAVPEGGMPYARSLDLGCSVGRLAFELARVSNLAVGIDLDFGKVSAAARIRRSRKLAFERREHGKAFRRVEGAFDPPQNVLFLVGDALDPPFPAASFDLVGALNLLDNVGVPLMLLGQMDALLREGGALLLGAPYEWRTEIADPTEWFETGTVDAPSFLRRLLEGKELPGTGFRFSVEQEHADVPWTMRAHARRWTLFLSHMIRARKGIRIVDGGVEPPRGGK